METLEMARPPRFEISELSFGMNPVFILSLCKTASPGLEPSLSACFMVGNPSYPLLRETKGTHPDWGPTVCQALDLPGRWKRWRSPFYTWESRSGWSRQDTNSPLKPNTLHGVPSEWHDTQELLPLRRTQFACQEEHPAQLAQLSSTPTAPAICRASAVTSANGPQSGAVTVKPIHLLMQMNVERPARRRLVRGHWWGEPDCHLDPKAG